MTRNTTDKTTGLPSSAACETSAQQGWAPARRLLASALAAATLFAISVATSAPAFANQWCTSC
ncbi:MAG: hypothetical protein ACRDI2_18975 [Chloroflexota bacterium]